MNVNTNKQTNSLMKTPGSTMIAATYDQYGGPEVVSLGSVATPKPKKNEVLIQIIATTIASGDWRMRSAEVPGSFKILAPLIFGRRPKKKILGTELSGIVVKVGRSVRKWKVGDEVFAFPGVDLGAHAEFICLREDGKICRKPSELSFEQAAALCFGGSTALSFFEKAGGIDRGDKVLIIGAGGAVGSTMLQIALYFGAIVSAVCSGEKQALVQGLGADEVIDYKKIDIKENREQFNIICDTVGIFSASSVKGHLKPGGRALLVMAGLGDIVRSIRNSTIVAGPAKEDPKYLPYLAGLAAKGDLKPLIGETFPFSEIVQAHRLVDTGHKTGSIVVKVNAG